MRVLCRHRSGVPERLRPRARLIRPDDNRDVLDLLPGPGRDARLHDVLAVVEDLMTFLPSSWGEKVMSVCPGFMLWKTNVLLVGKTISLRS